MKHFILAALLSTSASASPALRPERVVLRTDAGDLVLALYADAPRHAEKLLGLFRSGAYDSARFAKIDSSRFAAVTSAPNAPRAARLPVENGGPHRAGVVSMAHQPDDADPGETAFVILFADIAGMDGRFSSVGEVVGGLDALAALRAAPVDGTSRPVDPLLVQGSEVARSVEELGRISLRGPVFTGRAEGRRRRALLFGLAAVSLALGAGLTRARVRLGAAAPSAGLLAILVGFFAAFAALADLSASSAWVSIPLFAATVGVFRLMSRFER